MESEPFIDPEISDLFKKLSRHIRSRMKLIVFLFLLGLTIGIPLAHRTVDFLLSTDLVPSDVTIIILTPVEFIMLQVRIGAWLGAGLAIFALILEAGWNTGLVQKSPKPALSVIVSAIFVVLLATTGLIYSWNLLTPLLLEYLASDAQYAGLSTEWTLSSFVDLS